MAYLSPLWVGDAGVAQVALLPLGVEAVALQLPQLEGGVEGPGVHLDGDGVDDHRHTLHHLLSEAVLAGWLDGGGTMTGQGVSDRAGASECVVGFLMASLRNIESCITVQF